MLGNIFSSKELDSIYGIPNYENQDLFRQGSRCITKPIEIAYL